MTERIIAHLDLDSFFVSAERTLRPELRGRPVAVGGASGRGVISSASYEARKFGVRAAMPVGRAKVLCPELLLVKGDYELYQRLSRAVFELVSHYTPVVEATGIDEGYFDLTGTERLWGAPEQACRELQTRIANALGLPCSFGIGSNRRIAKIATEDAKPAGIFRVQAGDEARYLAQKLVRAIPGVGAKTDAWLRSRGVRTIRELQTFPVEVLERHLGSFGVSLARAAWGEGSVEFHREAKVPGASRERTFSTDLADEALLLSELRQLCRKLAEDLRRDDLRGRVLKLKIRYSDFQTLTRQKVLSRATRDPLDFEDRATELWNAHREKGRPVRLLGVGVTLDTDEGTAQSEQLDFFAEQEEPTEGPKVSLEKREKLASLADALTEKFGATRVSMGESLRRKK